MPLLINPFIFGGAASTSTNVVTVVFDDGGNFLSPMASAPITIPVAATISGWNISADAGTCTVRTWKKATGTAIPTVADSISTAGVSLSTGTHVRSAVRTDFTTSSISAGDMLVFELKSVAGATKVIFELEIAI